MNLDWKRFISVHLLNHSSGTVYAHSIRNLKTYHIQVYAKVIEETSFLPKDSRYIERLYVLYYGLLQTPDCSHCKSRKTAFINFKLGYREFGSTKCVANSDSVQAIMSIFGQKSNNILYLY